MDTKIFAIVLLAVAVTAHVRRDAPANPTTWTDILNLGLEKLKDLPKNMQAPDASATAADVKNFIDSISNSAKEFKVKIDNEISKANSGTIKDALEKMKSHVDNAVVAFGGQKDQTISKSADELQSSTLSSFTTMLEQLKKTSANISPQLDSLGAQITDGAKKMVDDTVNLLKSSDKAAEKKSN